MSLFKAKISYFFHPVPDLKQALVFFRDIMGFDLRFGHLTGLSPEAVNEELANIQWLEFAAGEITLLVQLVPSEKGNIETGIGFEVSNCDEALVYLKNQGITTSQISGESGKGKRVFYIKDPFGNSFGVFGQ